MDPGVMESKVFPFQGPLGLPGFSGTTGLGCPALGTGWGQEEGQGDPPFSRTWPWRVMGVLAGVGT